MRFAVVSPKVAVHFTSKPEKIATAPLAGLTRTNTQRGHAAACTQAAQLQQPERHIEKSAVSVRVYVQSVIQLSEVTQEDLNGLIAELGVATLQLK